MSEKLIIKNFGPIKSAEIELKRFTVLIGEQATGKSTIAKLLAVCRYFSYITGVEIGSASGILTGLYSWGFRDYISKGTVIYYSCPRYEYEASTQADPPHHAIGSHLKAKSLEFKQLLIDGKSYGNVPLPPSFFLNNVSHIMDNPFFLPVERGLQSIFSLGQDSIPNISNSLFNQFAKMSEIAAPFIIETNIDPLDIIYQNDSGIGRFKKNNEKEFHSLSNAASGYQSTIPVVLAVKYYHDIRQKSKTFIVEEPELSLFPVSQRNLVRFLVQESNEIQKNAKQSQFLLATHSPYILTSLNNCMYAYKIGKENHKEVDKIIPETNWLNPEEVSCYMLKADGTAEDILERKSGLIDVEKIDGISETLNKEFDELLKIEFTDQ